MGMISIRIEGSFPENSTVTFDAEEGGHALAIQRAIRHLNNLLPKAIRLDHARHAQSEYPPKSGFGEFPAHEPQGLADNGGPT